MPTLRRKTHSMVRVYGASDDLVEIRGSDYAEKEIDCYDHTVRLEFSDGTVVRFGYGKSEAAIWWCRVEAEGTATHRLIECSDEDSGIYSDIFEIEAEVVSHTVEEG